jgi:ubiquinone/menaquinone biosynthesis C-methylase UbiE
MLAPQALAGFADAATYDAHRPSYPQATIEQLLQNFNLPTAESTNGRPLRILELGAGTGLFTFPLIEYLDSKGLAYELVATDPHPKMLEQLSSKLSALKEEKPRAVTTLSCPAESIPFPPSHFAAILCAQSFHWFATPAALSSMHRVLAPGGRLGLLWNVESYNAPLSWASTQSWELVLRRWLFSHEDDALRFRHERWRDVFACAPGSGSGSGTGTDGFFAGIEEGRVGWCAWLGDEEVWSRFATLSQVATLGGEERERVREAVLGALRAEDTVRNEEGKVRVDGWTALCWTVKE